ncbi:ribulose-phosphate 3-epimerase [Nanoarchaeota archaeon]
MNKVSVSTLPMDLDHIDIDLFKVSTADYLHVDIMDGKFVPERTMWADELRLFKTALVKDVHLMIAEPEKHVEDFIDAGGQIISFHFEATKDPEKLIKKIKAKGAKAGIAINPSTTVKKIKDLVPLLDHVIIMSVIPGKGGQKFMKEVLGKAKELRDIKEEIDIEIDGGVNDKTAEMCVEAGVNVLCSGSYIFSYDDPKIAIDILRNS